ncbi:MAG: alpha/beta hydrolase [Roseovarius sp. BRH_c41]|jgi:pimeloyl-ACP methyl ester carboxylesterase|uniref:alpha/beta hydrolase n=1 Tax=Roseovarius sp. BRH_c41 TaxID=1629709 RepID=UPI0005F26365|nr:alpha/beta fold hydrolase [Roseovarius sp. BRH_c41]KJS44201.1 MAG: alpha/beta hydrolase [Roseovarius sp. BRH_c41]
MFRVIALLCVAALALWQLEGQRRGVEITSFTVSDTPVTRYAQPGADGPVVVVAHGFAGSRQMMQAYSLDLARAGYRVWAFDFEGHGRNRVPMSGDVTRIDGTTQLLVEQTRRVVEAAVAQDGYPGEVALLGHSMATDIIIRTALEEDRVGPVVAISAFSQAVTAIAPDNLLLISGAWEAGLRDFARDTVAMVTPGAGEGETVQSGDVTRRAVVAPLAEHVAVLHSRVGRTEAIDWLDTAYGRESDVAVRATGPWIMVLMGAIVALAWPLSRRMPQHAPPVPTTLSMRQFALVVGVPALLAPLLAVQVETRLLPVLVADYLVLHLVLYGVCQLALLWGFGLRPDRLRPVAVLALLVWGLGVFGFFLHRYSANFWPTPERLTIIAALSLGALPFMLADAVLTRGAPLWQRLGARLMFILSLGLAILLDTERLFFLAMIAPVILLFFLIFGLMGRWVAARAGGTSAGVALGLILAWALGVSFPLFAPGVTG